MKHSIGGLAIGLTLSVWAVSAPVFAADEPSVTIVADRERIVLGESLELAVTVRNDGASATEPLVVHIDITDPTQTSSVDPEDWTSTLSTSIGSVSPGESSTVSWTVQPIAGGSFSIYAVTLAARSERTAVSNVVVIDVDDRRSLDPGGILPVALGAPTIVGLLLVTRLRAGRRRR